jgi:hypothetical protein
VRCTVASTRVATNFLASELPTRTSKPSVMASVVSMALSTAVLLVEATTTLKPSAQHAATIAATTRVFPVPGGPVSTRFWPE